jgi:ribosomal protein S19
MERNSKDLCEKEFSITKKSAGHKSALKIIAEADKETLEKVYLRTLSREKVITEEMFVLHIKLQKKTNHLTILNPKLTYKN